MTTITSMEEFIAQPVDTVATVTGFGEWTRTGDGWRRNEDLLSSHLFQSYVENGGVSVSDTPAPPAREVGQIWVSTGGYRRLILRRQSERVWETAVWEGPGVNVSIQSVADNDSTSWHHLDENQDIAWKDVTLQLAARTADPQMLTDFRAQVGSALSEYIGDHDSLTEREREDLTEIMDDHGLVFTPPTEEVEVSVVIDGFTDVTLSSTDLQQHLDTDLTADDSAEVEVSWRTRLTRTFTVDENDCACGNIDRDMVENMMEDANISYSRISNYRSSCTND